jgi:4-hydroxy-tetrahydrodipicolinate synthase
MFTPFDEEGRLDLGKVPELVEFYIQAGCAGIFPVAGSGEMFLLTQEERVQVAKATVEAVGGRVQVIAGGNFGADTAAQIEAAKQIEDTGVDGLVLILSVVPLQSQPWNPEELVENTIRIGEALRLPLGMYECPSPEHRVLRPQDVAALAATGRFHFLKETTEGRDYVAEKVNAGKESPLRIFPASINVFWDEWIEGVGGFNGISANVIPEVFVKLCNLGKANGAYRREVRERVFDLQTRFLNELYPASGKFLLQLRGLSLGTKCRAGKVPVLSESQLELLRPLKELMEDLTGTALA